MKRVQLIKPTMVVRKWKKALKTNRFMKQPEVLHRHNTKYVVLYSLSQFVIICLNSATFPHSLSQPHFHCHCPYPGSHPFWLGLSPLSWFASFCSCYCFRLKISCYCLNLKNPRSFFNLSLNICLLAFMDCCPLHQIRCNCFSLVAILLVFIVLVN